MNIKHSLVAVAACVVALAATAMDVVLKPDGNIRIGERILRPAVIQLGWSVAAVKSKREIATPGAARLVFEGKSGAIMDGTVSLRQLGGGKVRIGYEFSALADVELETVCCSILLPIDETTGLGWRTGKKSGTFAQPANGGIHISSGALKSLELPLGKNGGMVRFTTTNKVSYLIQDSRKWEDVYTVRIGDRRRLKYEKGKRLAFELEVASNEPLKAADQQPYVIKAGDEWIPLDYRRDIIEGSALDFSGMGFADAPAGKYGWIRNVGGHFEFEGRPGLPQRFYGVNLTGKANFPDHATADMMATRFKRLGYNTIRVHHHDAGTVAGSTDSLTLDPASMDLLDYFVAAAIREGLYVTTDIFVSRSRVIKWRHIGVDRNGCVDMHLFKALCAVYEPALENWMAYARNFLMHLNPYTGRRYIDEPALPLISLINEGGFFMGWARGVRDDPRVAASWKSWLETKRASDPDFAPGVSADVPPEEFWAPKSYAAIAQWTGELEAKMVSRMKTFLRGIGCRALITDGNCGPHYAAMQMATVDYDYIDDHFYVDHPEFIEKRWQLPSRCRNVNPIIGKGRVPPCSKAFTRMYGKPFTISEWNFTGPGRYRGVGGILTGAMAALQDWDGLWRYTYSHSSEGLQDADVREPGYFDVARDPLAQASDRACMCLFLRGDIAPLADGVALLVTRNSVDRKKVLPGAPEWSGAAWSVRAGSCLDGNSARGMRVIRREDAEDASALADVNKAKARNVVPIGFDHRRGSFTIVTPRTCGGFVQKGTIAAGDLEAVVSGAPATVWVHSIDGKDIARSERILLTHLTDVQGDGVKFQDETMQVLLKWGKRPLVRNGSAEVSLRLENPGRYVVYELATSGRRVRKIQSSVSEGRLRFMASVAGPDGARMLYEIVRE